MERKLSSKEVRFLKELEGLLSRNGALITSLGGRVAFFIDNIKEGDCVPDGECVDAISLARLLREGKVVLDWKKSKKYSAEAKKEEAFFRFVDSRSGRAGIPVDFVDLKMAHTQAGKEPYKVTPQEFMELICRNGLQKVIDDTRKGRYEIAEEKPACISFTSEEVAEIMADVCQVKDMKIRESLISRLIFNK